MQRLERKKGYLNDRLGMDPELFIFKGKKFIPYVDIFGKKKKHHLYNPDSYTTNSLPMFIKDGVSVELNTPSYGCRQIMANMTRDIIRKLYSEMIKKDPTYIISNKNYVKLTEKQMRTLDEDSLNFGCAPSNNVYIGEDLVIEENPMSYPYRAAGGHIHLGYTDKATAPTIIKKIDSGKKDLVRILDILVGNTAVLFDKNKNNVERRKTYGKAGEYRNTSYGLEYRTLSNFWLRSYALLSLMMGLSRVALNIVAYSTKVKNSHVKSLLSLVKEEDIIKAINTNDSKLAKKNWDKIKKWLVDYAPNRGFVSWTHTVKAIDMLYKKDIDKYAPYSIGHYWNKVYTSYTSSPGWDVYAESVVLTKKAGVMR